MKDAPDTMPLGELKAWNVKDFPSALRERITLAAATQGVMVAEWLTAYFHKHGIDGDSLPALPVKTNRLIPAQPGVSELRELAELARTVTPPTKDSLAMRTARRLIHEHLRALR